MDWTEFVREFFKTKAGKGVGIGLCAVAILVLLLVVRGMMGGSDAAQASSERNVHLFRNGKVV